MRWGSGRSGLDTCDPSGRRTREAFKRLQLITKKPEAARRPFTRFYTTIQVLFNHPIVGAGLGRLLSRIIGLDRRALEKLYTDAEAKRAARMSFEEHAQEALQAKYQTA